MKTNHQRLLADFIGQMRARYGGHIECIMAFILPFAKPKRRILVVLANSASELWHVYRDAGPELLKNIDVLCLRVNELFQLGLPGPNVAASSASYWIHATGRLLYGRDLRHEIPIDRPQQRLLASRLDWVQSSRHHMVRYLLDRQYDALHNYLRRQRAALMCAALMERRIWQVYPETVARQFFEAYPDAELRRNAEALDLLRRQLAGAGEEQKGELACREAWLFETFLRELWRYAS